MELTVNSILHFLTASNGMFLLFFGIIQFFQQKKSAVHYWGIVVFFLAAINMLFYVLFQLEAYYQFPHILYISYPLEYGFSAALYFFLVYLFDNTYQPKWYHYLLFLPSVITLLALLPYYLQSGDQKLYNILLTFHGNAILSVLYTIIDYSIELFMLACISLFLIQRRKQLFFRKKYVFMTFFFLTCISWCILYFIALIVPFSEAFDSLQFLGSTLVVIFCVYFLKRPDHFSSFIQYSRVDDSHPGGGQIANINTSRVIEKLTDVMCVQKMFMQENLSLNTLANELDISSHQLSELINIHLQKSFSDYINGFRIEHAKKLLLRNPKMSILDIGFQSGFNSKSTFNMVFKKNTGLTPSQYKRQRAE